MIRPKPFDRYKCLITITAITISGFHCPNIFVVTFSTTSHQPVLHSISVQARLHHHCPTKLSTCCVSTADVSPLDGISKKPSF